MHIPPSSGYIYIRSFVRLFISSIKKYIRKKPNVDKYKHITKISSFTLKCDIAFEFKYEINRELEKGSRALWG